MSIATELQNYADGLDDAYDAVNDMSGIIPQHKNMNNLDQAIRTIPQNTGTTYTAGNGINIDANNEISIDDTVVAELSDLPGVMTGATSGTAGASGLVPAPAAGDEAKVLSGAGTWVNQPTIPTVPTKTSDLTNNGDDGTHPFLATDDVATVATSGDYDDLLNKPTIPSYSDFTGATASTAGAHGLVPAPAAGDDTKYLKGDGTWGTPADAGGAFIGYLNMDHDNIAPGASAVYKDTTYSISGLLRGSDIDAALLDGKSVYFKFKDGDYYIKVLCKVDTYLYTIAYGGKTNGVLSNTGGGTSWFISNAMGTLKSVNDATLTIQHNGTDVQTFTANASSNATANIETIYADTVAPASSVAPISTTTIQDGAVTFSKLGITTENVTNWKNGFSGTLKVMTIGKLHFLTGQVSGTLSSSAYNTVATLPASATGATIPGLEACGCARAQDYPCTITISGNGDIVLRPAGGTPVWARITMMWITN